MTGQGNGGKGQALVEFALVVIGLMLLLLGILEFGYSRVNIPVEGEKFPIFDSFLVLKIMISGLCM